MTAAAKTNPEIAEEAIAFVCARFRLNREQLVSKTREFHIVWPRWCAIHLIAKNTTLTVNQVGKLFNRCHTNISHSKSALKNQIETSSLHRDQLAVIEREFKP